ncbi:GIY-YIG nuclease family protein [Halobium salinum]|uniref:GIY-YIG nuclease family protein n=1 Tax=Halobium salinum TaxID=1364940 RepID=A0ABD5PBC5_9EURY
MRYVPAHSFVYAIGYRIQAVNQTDSLSYNIKIGHSQNPEQRRSQLQTGNPNRLSLFASQCTALPEAAETELKSYYRELGYRRRGEWFCLPKSDFDSLMQEVDDAVIRVANREGIGHQIQTRIDSDREFGRYWSEESPSE